MLVSGRVCVLAIRNHCNLSVTARQKNPEKNTTL